MSESRYEQYEQVSESCCKLSAPEYLSINSLATFRNLFLLYYHFQEVGIISKVFIGSSFQTTFKYLNNYEVNKYINICSVSESTYVLY